MHIIFRYCSLLILALLAASQASAEAESTADTPPAKVPQAETQFLPAGDLFRPLIADFKLPRFAISYRQYHYHEDIIYIAAVGVGELFGLYRSVDSETGAGWQVSFGGGLLAQFNLDASSKDLMNADYFVGFPFSYRNGAVSYRVLLYHQSSHLGDEYLLHASPTRMEFSYEALNAVHSYEWRQWRGYYGGEAMLRKEPNSLKTFTVQAGIEFHGASPIWGRGVPVAGLDLKSTQEHDWAINVSLAAGLEFKGDPHSDRTIRVVLEAYQGHNPHGQFYTENTRIRFHGIGVQMGY